MDICVLLHLTNNMLSNDGALTRWQSCVHTTERTQSKANVNNFFDLCSVELNEIETTKNPSARSFSFMSIHTERLLTTIYSVQLGSEIGCHALRQKR